MQKNILSNCLLLLAACISFTSCKTQKNSVVKQQQPGIEIPYNKVSLIDIQRKQVDFSTFSTKAKGNISLDKSEYDVTLNLRIKKGQVIWASVTALAGIEIARLYITPDSIKIINRPTNEYIKKPFSFIHNYVGSAIDFNTLESIFVGNTMPLALKKGKVALQDNIVSLTGEQSDMKYQFTYTSLLELTKLILEDKEDNQNLNLNYKNYLNVDGKSIPEGLNIQSLLVGKSLKLDLVYNNSQFNGVLEFPFNVPNRFTIID